MTIVEYRRSKNEFLLTAYTGKKGDTVKFHFVGEPSGTLYIGGAAFKVDAGFATVKINSLKEGVHTPLLRTEDASFVCDKIKVEAGVIAPEICDTERILYLTEKIISAEDKAYRLEEKLSELCDAVYGKSIL